MSCYDDDDYYYEPSLADEILTEFGEKMKTVLLDAVKQDIENLHKENDRLKTENQKLKDSQQEVYALKRSVEYEKKNLLMTVRRERLSELMKDFNVILYRVYNKGKKLPKCDKCNDDREISFTSPSGKQMAERCDCNVNIKDYVPREYHCSEFRIDRDNKKMLVWFKLHEDHDYDYYTYSDSSLAEVIYNQEMNYEDLNSGTYFRTKEECQKYCDWLNAKGLEI